MRSSFGESPHAENGDCDAAYKVGRHHMYVSLDYINAEKYFRLAANCANVDAKLALITVLRGQHHDIEVDSILLSLKEVDEKAWAGASKEVVRIRTSRNHQWNFRMRGGGSDNACSSCSYCNSLALDHRYFYEDLDQLTGDSANVSYGFRYDKNGDRSTARFGGTTY